MKREEICRMFSAMPTLRTGRLTLRPMQVSDARDMYAYARREDVTAYLLWSPHPSEAYTAEYLRYIRGRYALGEFYDWAVVENAAGRMIGTCGFTRFDLPHNVGEIGYVLNPDYHGKGYGTEAAERVIRFGFEVLGLHRIEAKFIQGNEASRHVMEKLGMTFEGYRRDGMLIKNVYRTIGTCAMLEQEYARGKRAE
ncbi:MAG: GNAT family N-acetyltransferase [Clostridia bacterium]|nr:GNAT family N-acetyltransferase [Clostridia bacterium]